MTSIPVSKVLKFLGELPKWLGYLGLNSSRQGTPVLKKISCIISSHGGDFCFRLFHMVLKNQKEVKRLYFLKDDCLSPQSVLVINFDFFFNFFNIFRLF